MRSRIPIAVVLSSFEPGDTERQMIEVVRRLDRSHFDVHVACIGSHGPLSDVVRSLAGSATEFPFHGFHRSATVAAARRFGHWCREREIAVVHAAGFRATVVGLPTATFAGVPVRIASRRVECRRAQGAARGAMLRAAYACAQRVVASSLEAAEALAAERVPADRVRVIREGIEVAPFRTPWTTPIRRIAVIAPPAAGVHEAWLDALVHVLERARDARSVIASAGDVRNLAAALTRRRLEGRLSLASHALDLRRLLASSDLAVVPRWFDGAAHAVLEAMAAGLPTVATRTDALDHLIDHQRTGVLVAPDDSRALAWGVLDLIAWPAHARRLGAAARGAVERRHDADAMVAAHERLYMDALRARFPVALADAHVAAS